ncbi:SDR family oxidoreductase [Alicyclobacillus mengziensis]|uniref:SDR family oxidoreductase n=2 Tax=Alicyclobacillus mengziensis TaxID=2931921 RepID=A0A9X7W4M6_9BACL|nr:SDR family oxidoreductase [Alicyclobacillus mengziensis]
MFSTTRPLYGQTAIVTGASRGIGRSIAIALGRAGAHVVVNYLKSQAAAAEVVETILNLGSKAIAVQADVSSPEEVETLVTASTSLGAPQILVNNAGISQSRLLLDTSLEEWDRMLKSNLTAPFLCTKAVLPYMLRSGYGRIVNISSIWGISGGSFEVAYSASKGGIIAFTKALAKEIGPSGITVNAVAPGAIETDMLQGLSQEEMLLLQARTPVGRLGHPDDVANAVVFLVSPRTSYITGQVISPNGGLES